MFTYDLLIPWVRFGLMIGALLFVQRWIHRHLFGMGYLIGKQKHAATLFYYLLLLPGVFLHEFSHYMMAGVFGIGHKKFELFPRAQDDGSLEMGFIELEEVKNPVHAAFIGIAPLLTGMAVVVYISNSMLNLPELFQSFRNGDLTVRLAALQLVTTKPDFLLWTYIAFAVANSMMPSAEDWRGWWLVGAGTIIVLLFLTIIGFQTMVVNFMAGQLSQAFSSLTAVFGTVLALDCCAAVFIWIVEAILERVTGHKVEYKPLLPAPSSKALQTQPKLLSVYDLHLPLPPAPGKALKPAPARLPAGGERPAVASGQRPGLPTGNQPARPGLPAATPAPSTGTAPKVGPPATVSGPPALRPATPAPKPASSLTPFGTPPRPGQPARPLSGGKDDNVIDADVVEEEDDTGDDVKYVDEPDL